MLEKYIWVLCKDQPTSMGTRITVAFNDKQDAIEFIKKLCSMVDRVIYAASDYSIVDCVETGIPTCYYLKRCVFRYRLGSLTMALFFFAKFTIIIIEKYSKFSEKERMKIK